MLEVVNISKTFNNTKALDNINITLGNKGLVVILGESGSGKSTLFNTLTGIVKPDSGSVIFNGIELNTDGKINSNNVFGIIFQDNNLLDGLTVKQNLDICSTNEQKQMSILQNLGIEKYINTRVDQLSGGEMQRVAIARTLLANNDILLADEPTGSLDEKNGENVMSILKEISTKKLVVVITHNIQFAAKYADRIVKISKGKIVEDSRKDFVKKYVKEKIRQNVTFDSLSTTPNDKQTERCLSATILNKFCFAKIKNTLVKSITSICILAVMLAMIALSLALIMTNCRQQYLKSIQNFEHSALYNDKDMSIFASKLTDANMQGLTKYYNHFGVDGQSMYIVVDNSLEDNEILLGAGVADNLNEKQLIPIKTGDIVNYYKNEFIVKGIVERHSYGHSFDLNLAVYLNDKVAKRIILIPDIVLLDSQYRIEMTVIKDPSLQDGECKLGFGLYYNLATRDEKYIDLKKNNVNWIFSENNTKLYSQDYTIVGIDTNHQNIDDHTLYVSSKDYDRISASRLYYGYFLKTQDTNTLNYWLEKGVEIYNQDFENYIRASDFRKMLLPYAIVMLVVGIVLSVLYLVVVQNHIVAVNKREIYILKSLSVSNKSILGLQFLQSLPIILCANILIWAITIIMQNLIEKHIQFLVLQIVISNILLIVFSLILALVLIAIKTHMLNKNFDIKYTK